MINIKFPTSPFHPLPLIEWFRHPTDSY